MSTSQYHEVIEAAQRREDGPLLRLRLSFAGHPWRMAPLWSVLAGAAAAGMRLVDETALFRLAGAMILADLAWGVLWRVSRAGAGYPAASWPDDGILPYAQRGAPLADMIRQLRIISAAETQNFSATAEWHEPVIGVGLTVGLSLLLGIPALVLSLVVLGVALAAWGLNRRGISPAMAGSLLTLGLPWALGASLVGWNELASAPRLGDSMILAAAFTLLAWGGRRAQLLIGSRCRGIWLGQIAVLAVLIVLQQPWTVAVVAALFLPPTLWLIEAKKGNGTNGINRALIRSAPWWWGALLLAAFALR